MSVEQNPFELVFDALWNQVEISPAFTDLVKLKNRIKFNHETNRDVIKQEIQVADLPEVVLSTEGMVTGNLHNTSSTCLINRQYAFLVSTGDHRVNYLLNKVEWAIFCALTNWKGVLDSLVWRGQSFVKNCNLLAVSEGLSDKTQNRGITGWSTIWRCHVTMYFNSKDVIEFANENVGSTSGSEAIDSESGS